MIAYGTCGVRMSDIITPGTNAIDGSAVEWRAMQHGLYTLINNTTIVVGDDNSVSFGNTNDELKFTGTKMPTLQEAQSHALMYAVAAG